MCILVIIFRNLEQFLKTTTNFSDVSIIAILAVSEEACVAIIESERSNVVLLAKM